MEDFFALPAPQILHCGILKQEADSQQWRYSYVYEHNIANIKDIFI